MSPVRSHLEHYVQLWMFKKAEDTKGQGQRKGAKNTHKQRKQPLEWLQVGERNGPGKYLSQGREQSKERKAQDQSGPKKQVLLPKNI